MALIDEIKVALRVTSTAFDDEISGLIEAAKLDLGVAGVTAVSEDDALIVRAIATYCKANFGNSENYDKLKASYDEQKAQLSTHTGHTTWSEDD